MGRPEAPEEVDGRVAVIASILQTRGGGSKWL